MSAASVLSFSPSAMPGPVMPMDVAMRFYISHSPPPLRGFLSPYEDLQRAKQRADQQRADQQRADQHQHQQRLRPCLSSGKAGKKRVVFADTKGMSLTAVHVFSKFDDEPRQRAAAAAAAAEDLQFDLSDLEAATRELKLGPARGLALDFKQPSADYLDFRNRLIRNSVCLENCSLQERSLTGTVKVRNLGFEKAVRVRVTYDSWASFSDVDCTFMNNVYGCQDTDTFAFVLELPAAAAAAAATAAPPPHDRVEFCICFTAQDRTFWDNNDGKNYVLKHVGWNGEDLTSSSSSSSCSPAPPAATSLQHRKGGEEKGGGGGGVKLLELDFDQFGSPRMSSGLFPGWQSWGQIDTGVPYW